jgi:exosortase/archaeosortase family protein
MNLLLLLVASFAVIGIMDWFLIVQSQTLINVLSNWIMWYSKQILFLFGFDPIVKGYQIELGNYWVYLGTPCLGAGVMTMFVVLVTIIRSPVINKIFFVIIGINLLIFANAIRVVSILLHIYLNQIPQALIDDYHSMSNNFFYIMVLIMLFIYVRWFKNIEFRK